MDGAEAMIPLKREVEAVAALLEAGAEDSTALAKLVIAEVERVRAERTTHMVVMRMGQGVATTYYGYGPYSTKAQGVKAFEKNPAAGLATAYAVVPTTSAEGLELLIASVDAKPELKGDWKLVKEDAERFAKQPPRRSRTW